jgi:hypothetical protein
MENKIQLYYVIDHFEQRRRLVATYDPQCQEIIEEWELIITDSGFSIKEK